MFECSTPAQPAAARGIEGATLLEEDDDAGVIEAVRDLKAVRRDRDAASWLTRSKKRSAVRGFARETFGY